MKKSLFLLMAASTCVLLLNSCTKESSSSDNGMIPLTITAGLPDTKATFTEDANGLAVKWQATNESFGVYSGASNTTLTQFTASPGTETSSAAFSGDIATGSTTLYAVYPYNGSATNVAAIPFDLSNQVGSTDGKNLTSLATKLPMVASATYVQGKNPTLQFS